MSADFEAAAFVIVDDSSDSRTAEEIMEEAAGAMGLAAWRAYRRQGPNAAIAQLSLLIKVAMMLRRDFAAIAARERQGQEELPL